MKRCKYVNQVGQQCGMPEGHSFQHANGLLTTPRDTWDLPPIRNVSSIPTFTIKASDPFACAVIRTWCIMAASWRGKVVDPKTGERKTVSLEKINCAFGRLEEFLLWQYNNSTKVPD